MAGKYLMLSATGVVLGLYIHNLLIIFMGVRVLKISREEYFEFTQILITTGNIYIGN